MDVIGYWSVNEDYEIPGTLKSNDDKFELEILGSFDKKDLMEETYNFEVVHGITKNGKIITLLDCTWAGTSISTYGYQNKRYICKNIIIGEKKYGNLNEINVNSACLKFDYLNSWIGISLATIMVNRQQGNMNVNIQNIQNIRYEFDDFDLYFIFDCNLHNDSTYTNISWNQYTKVKLVLKKTKNLEEILEYINSLERFLSFCIGEDVKCREIICKDDDEIKLELKNNITREVEKIMSKFNMQKKFIIFKDIEENFKEVYDRWLTNKNRLQPIISKILQTEKSPGKYIEQEDFMNIVSAMEVYSRRFLNNCKMDEKEYDKMITEILEEIKNPKYNDWLERRLKYSNEPSLNARIKDILTKLPKVAKISSRKRDTIAYKTVNTRNFYTHFGEIEKSEKTFKLNESVIVFDFYKIYLKLLIADDLGIDLEKILSNNDKIYYGDLRCIKVFKEKFKID